jgi:predicted dehydrogenase
MVDRRFQVGLIGTSWWADLEHLPGLGARGDVEVAALCGRDPAKLATLAAKHRVGRTFTDWRAMIAAGGLDVLVIAAPNALHREPALAAIDAGLHVVCEKPLAMNVAEAREMAARAEAAGRKTLTFFTHRALAAAVQVKRMVDAGFLGRPVHASALYHTASHLRPGKAHAWRMVRAQSGTGVLGDIGSHLVDLVRWWMGDLRRVAAQWQVVNTSLGGAAVDADESVAFLAELASGAQATFHASKLVAGRGNYLRVDLHGTAGSLVFEADPGFDPTWEGRVLAGRPERPALEPVTLPPELSRGLDAADNQAGRNEAYRRLTDPFFAAIRSGGDAHPDFRDGAAVQAVLDAVALSAEERRWVDVP